MKFIISGKNIEVTDALRDKIEEKIGKLDKFFYPDTKVNAVMSVQKTDQTIEVTIPHNKSIFKAVESHEDMYHSIDKVVDTLERQIKKHKTRSTKKNHDNKIKTPSILFEEQNESVESEDNNPKIIRTKRYAVKPMALDEAAMQFQLTEDDFMMFTNANTEQINVLYKRHDGNFGLIEPEE